MSRNQRPLVAWILVSAALLWGCSSGLGSLHGAAGAGGASGSGGTEAGPGGSAGSDAGLTCPSCSAGEYCQASSGKCIGCNDLSQLDFGPPEPLSAINSQNVAGGLRFPRVAGPNGDELVYVANNNALDPPGQQIWFAASPDTAAGNPLSANTASASGPLYVQFNYVAGTNTNIVFDRVAAPGQSSARDLYATSLSAQGMATAAALPAPFNMPGTDDFSIAVAAAENRAWWMSDRNTGAPHLVTIALQPIGSVQDVSLSIQIDPHNTCLRAAGDATPWATPDGSVMLFSAVRLDASCHPADGGKRGLYSVRLDQSGRPDGGAAGQPLIANETGVDQTDPSLSPDLCTLYYAADDGAGFKLYRAPRR